MAIPPREQAIRTATRWCGVLVLGVIASIVSAQPQWRLDPIGGWGGPVNHVQIERDIAYVGAGQRLVVLDISDEANPTELGSIGLVKAVQDFVVRDGYAFVATHDTPYRFCVVDVSDLTAMRVVWSATRSEVGRAMEVDLFGDIAYVRGGPTGVDLEAFDITNPESPVHMGQALSSSGGFAIEEAQIVGSLLYVAGDRSDDGRGRFDIYNVSGDPENPLLLASLSEPFPLNSEVSQVAVEEPYAYLIVDERNVDGDRSYLWVVEVADPENPASVGNVVITRRDEFGFVANDVAVRDQVVYVADWAGESPVQIAWLRARGLAIFDAADPADPTFVRNIKTHGTVRGVRAAGDRLYVLDDGEGLFIVDIADRLNPLFLGKYHSPALLRDMVRDGDLLYVCDGWNGFSVLDVSDPSEIELRGVYQTTSQAGLGLDIQGIGIAGNHAYIAVLRNGVEKIDVSDPANPVLVGSFRPANHLFKGLAVSTDYQDYETILHAGIAQTGPPFLSLVVNIDASAMQEVGRVVIGSQALKVIRSEAPGDGHPIAMTANHFSVPWILDQSDPRSPAVHVGEGPDTELGDIDAQDGFWYIASGESDPDFGGLYVVDVHDPDNPIEVAYVRGVSRGVAVQDERLYVSDSQPSATMDVFDVRDPAAPELLLSTGRGTVGTFTRLLADEPFVFGTSSASTGLAERGDIGLVAFVSSCPADFTGSGDPNDPGYGVPDGTVDAEDFFYFLDQFAAGNAGVADLTGSSDPDEDEYGIPDGEIDVDDFFYFLDLFVLGCR